MSATPENLRRVSPARGFRALTRCAGCGDPAPFPAKMHAQGWLIEADDEGIALIACPDCRSMFEQSEESAAKSDSAAA